MQRPQCVRTPWTSVVNCPSNLWRWIRGQSNCALCNCWRTNTIRDEKMVILPGFSGKWTPFIQYLVLLLSSRLVRWGTRLGVDSTWHPEESVEMNNPEWFSERDQEGSPLSVTSSGDKMRLGRAKQMQMSPTIRELHSPDSIFWLLSTPPLLGSEETKNRGPLRRRWLMTQATHSFLTKNPIQIGELETWARGGDWNLSYNICFLGNIWAWKYFITIVLWW